MDFKYVILWTDALIYLLVAVIIAFIFYARSKEPLRAPWRQVGRSRQAMASLVVLLAYVSIGLLDSIHFRAALDNALRQITTVGTATEDKRLLRWNRIVNKIEQ